MKFSNLTFIRCQNAQSTVQSTALNQLSSYKGCSGNTVAWQTQEMYGIEACLTSPQQLRGG